MSQRVIEVFAAHAAVERTLGLMFMPPLPSAVALHLKPCRCVHTALLHFPIDVVFLDARHAILKIVDSLPPWRMTGHRSARSVLEFNAGDARSLGLRPGDTLTLTEAPIHDRPRR